MKKDMQETIKRDFLRKYLTVFLLFAISFFSCKNSFELEKKDSSEVSYDIEGLVVLYQPNSKDNLCSLRLSIFSQSFRTALPDIALNDFTSFTLSGKLSSSSSNFQDLYVFNATDTSSAYTVMTSSEIFLQGGTWDLKLSCEGSDGADGAVYQGFLEGVVIQNLSASSEPSLTISFTLYLLCPYR